MDVNACYTLYMRNYAAKSNKQVVRYRTPSSFKTRQAEATKRHLDTPVPYRPPSRGQRRGVNK